jgi:twitching motility protein PilU
LAQRLVPGKNKRRAAAVEILINSPHVQELIKKGDVLGAKEALRTSSERGMQHFDTALYQLYQQGRITLDDALLYADSRTNLEAKINFG